jgi:signal transduction histidine kinase
MEVRTRCGSFPSAAQCHRPVERLPLSLPYDLLFLMGQMPKSKLLQPQVQAIAAAPLTVIAVGLVDYATEWQYSFSVFYLLALSTAAWFVGRTYAYFIAIFSVVVSLVGDFASGPRYSSPVVPFWNAFFLLVVYAVVVELLSRLRRLTRGLEAEVRQRTAALTSEMAERERLERELLEVSEREQRRIGHDLHDSLGQHLTGAALAGQVLAEKLEGRSLPEAADAAKVVELVEGGIALSRKLAKGLDPIEMGSAGLMQALDELAETSSGLFKVRCRFECDSPVLVKNSSVAVHLYRIAQEAVTNAIKHGKARLIVIRLETTEDGMELSIRDDGLGLPDPSGRGSGMGLRIMAHRAGMIGADFTARRGETAGTVVECKMAVEPAAGETRSRNP